jgi:flagellar export protein FliJ
VFRFRLQDVLDLRVEREQKAASELTQARARVRAAEEEKALLEGVIAEGYARLASASAARSVGEMRSRCYVIDQLGARVSRAAEAVERAVAEVESSHRDFQAAFKGRMVLYRLKQRQREEWRAEEGRAERAEMDEVARTRVPTNSDLREEES